MISGEAPGIVELVGRGLLGVGAVLVVVGLGLVLAGRLGLVPRPLPGDLLIQRPGLVVYVPVVTMLLLSALGTLAVYLLTYLRR